MVAAATRRPFASPSDAYAVAVSRHPWVRGFEESSLAGALAPLAAGFGRFTAGRARFVVVVPPRTGSRFADELARLVPTFRPFVVFFATCASSRRAGPIVQPTPLRE